ncbi:hypothetical protein E1267_27080 [Nonomuraea longispora]|uniref:Uncharacterized protein n=1 Tax=Nonomuraea longispora TaxID=1848320 RepID=A0A4R4N7Q2_9ACTN|nr:hypothetical protein [Nonomuraea longispora]TDC03180.1 hypothetical protein E1267_27080 [Nonomuraea longispora]
MNSRYPSRAGKRSVTMCAELELDVDCTPRTDNSRYLELVRPWFKQIGAQLAGLTRRHGGP